MSRTTIWRVIGLASFLFAVLTFPCLASESSEGGWAGRELWDLAWRWINFGILVFVFMRYAKTPLIDFLASKREDMVAIFDDLKEEEQEMAKRQEEQSGLLARMDERIEQIREHYRRVGREEKERILGEAREFEAQLADVAEQRALAEFEKGKARFRKEVVEYAVGLAEERIRERMEEEDQERLVQRYIGSLSDVEASTSAH